MSNSMRPLTLIKVLRCIKGRGGMVLEHLTPSLLLFFCKSAIPVQLYSHL